MNTYHRCFSAVASGFIVLAASVPQQCGGEVQFPEPNPSARVGYAAQKLLTALMALPEPNETNRTVRIVSNKLIRLKKDATLSPESYRIVVARGEADIYGGDDSGVLYGALELAARIRNSGAFPEPVEIQDEPAMKLRGTCVGMQKTGILPDRKVYEYPYTPELFPWFYQKELWQEYLDFLVENRFNSLYLWNGHPFASLVRLKEYPDAVEVPDEVFTRNVEMFRWLAAECDKRGIWLVQMFYNIFLPKPLAEKHGTSTQLSAPTPLASDYTRKSIAEFVKQYPNVGLMICLGEALQGTSNQIAWATQTILPGVHDGMRMARLRSEPPVVIRTHAMNPEAIMPECFQVYSNLFTETKYTGESLTTYEPRGKAQATHLAMAKLGPHVVNVHILSNLEPFRYGAQRFIQKALMASRDRFGASGLHLYPLAYWNWPYSPDKITPPLKQWQRDWMWFEAWGRYAWQPDRSERDDLQYWTGRLRDFYGCGEEAAGKLLQAINDAGEVAPILVRRFGITEGNRQTLSLGMTLDQLVNPSRYNAITELWESQAPPGERLDEYVSKEWNKEPHLGETPVSAIAEVLGFAQRSGQSFDAIEGQISRNVEAFLCWKRDANMILEMARFYEAKVDAARHVLLHQRSGDLQEMERAGESMVNSLRSAEKLTSSFTEAYHFANSMQTGHRKIPFPGAANGIGTNWHWAHVLPLYRQELKDFQTQLAALKNPSTSKTELIPPWPPAKVTLLSTNAETYEIKAGARPFKDRRYTIIQLAPELAGLTGIRFSHEAAKTGRYEPVEFEVSEPVRVLVGYFQSDRDIWLQVPNLDVASHADERGGIEPVIRNAASIQECPNVNVHAFRYEAGKHKLELIGKGGFVVLGVVPASKQLTSRDAQLK